MRPSAAGSGETSAIGTADEVIEAGDLTVVIPTRDRWPVLRRSLEALAKQSVIGFEVVVVVDGEDQEVPDLPGVKVVVVPHAGPGVARNIGAAQTTSRLILFLGDDIIPTPDLVRYHLDFHRVHADLTRVSLGLIEWHPEVADLPLSRWLDWSGTQFEFSAIEALAGTDVGFGRFYSSNVCVKRELFDAVGGFDPDFYFLYEDIDLGYRLSREGMQLIYEPRARGLHLHGYEWPGIVRRFDQAAESERLMVFKHPDWFEPFFLNRMRWIMSLPPVSPLWARIVDHVPRRFSGLRRIAEDRANRHYFGLLAPRFCEHWDRQEAAIELREYLGAGYDRQKLWNHRNGVEREARESADEASFYRESEAYLYDLTVFSMSGTKDPYLNALRGLLAPNAKVLDYGCGIGSDGLELLEAGYDVAFADFDNPSTRYLRWRGWPRSTTWRRPCRVASMRRSHLT
jgi:GT2 family glycosyltransferase